MVTRLDLTRQFTLVNAPAGSGKTTAISNDILRILPHTSRDILCITYTNRAAEELDNKISSDRVRIATIHSFISNFMFPFFRIAAVVDFYFEYYKDNIDKEIESLSPLKKDKYKEKFGLEDQDEVNFEIVKSNLINLEYNEMQFSDWLYGGLSHNELLIFSSELLKRFPKTKDTLTQKYSYIFIDEYQDTHASVLQMFYDAVSGGSTKLILLGDSMQQIYSDTVEGFKEKLANDFSLDSSLNMNWRSQESIVNLLNEIYLDGSFKQSPVKPQEAKPKFKIVDTFNNQVEDGTLKLVLLNSKMYESIGALTLYNTFSNRYSYFSKSKLKDVMSDMTLENPDDLLRLLVFLTRTVELYNQGKYGELIQMIKRFKYSNKSIWNITQHRDKSDIKEIIEELEEKLSLDDLTIKELLDFLSTEKLVRKIYIDAIIENIKKTNEKSPDFESNILGLKYTEFNNCYHEMQCLKISTQHAVKGEGHDFVTLELEDNGTIKVYMYLFLEVFSKNIFKYSRFEEMVAKGKLLKKCFEVDNNVKVSKISKKDYERLEEECKQLAEDLYSLIDIDVELYNYFFEEKISALREKGNAKKFMELLRVINRLEGVMQAYKLFYVGCSRAKKDLTVLALSDNVEHYRDELITKMEDVGFAVV